MKKPFSGLFLLAGVLAGFATFDRARAQQVTNTMTCEQAKSVYLSQGRIYTRTRSGAVLPIYGGVPAAEGRTLFCGRQSMRTTVRVITSDERRCVIAYRCS